MPFQNDSEMMALLKDRWERDRALRDDPSLAHPTLRDLDYLERRVRELEEKVERLEAR